jgi:choline dehydrogenase
MNQQKLSSNLKAQYDFVACGSGSSGSVVARRLADNPDVSVLLLEAGGGDDISEVVEADQWPMNLGSERDWSFQTQPNSNLNCRSIQLPMGKGTFEHGRSDRVGFGAGSTKTGPPVPRYFGSRTPRQSSI